MATYPSSTRRLPGTPWWLLLLEGVAALLVGILLLTQTGVTLVALAVLLGAYWFVTGIIDLVMLFVDRSQWGWKLVSGIVGVIAGLVILRHPLWASMILPATFVWILGGAGVVIGAVFVVRAFMGGGWWMGILAALSIVLGVLLLIHTLFSTAVLVYTVAIFAVAAGIVAIIAAFVHLYRDRSGSRTSPAVGG